MTTYHCWHFNYIWFFFYFWQVMFYSFYSFICCGLTFNDGFLLCSILFYSESLKTTILSFISSFSFTIGWFQIVDGLSRVYLPHFFFGLPYCAIFRIINQKVKEEEKETCCYLNFCFKLTTTTQKVCNEHHY